MLNFGGFAPQEPKVLAAVDLGSNSFHMIVARMEDGQLHTIDRLREMVGLANGLDENKHLIPEAQARALACLERFGQRLRDMPSGCVRAVGTNTLRKARNGDRFRALAERALGHPIEVIAGREEARLIYLGVAHGREGDESRRLVIDIGGGSTEIIIGAGFETVHRDSLYMGAAGFAHAFFPDGVISPQALRRAETAARREVETIEHRYRRAGWAACAGCSGTIRAVGAVLRAQGWSDGSVTAQGMAQLRAALLRAGHTNRLSLSGLKDERRPIFAGGFAVLQGIFEQLGLERMRVSDMALREGLLFDLLGRFRHEDIRARTVVRLAKRLGVDAEQADRVEKTALDCLRQIAPEWGLDTEEAKATLRWAARLHEIGLVISRNQHHKHGQYMLRNADLAGFSRREQAVLAALVRGSRRRFPSAAFNELPEPEREAGRKLCVLLRLAVALHRGRDNRPLAAFRLKLAKDDPHRLKLRFPEPWLEQHPLTQADLKEEAEFLKEAGFGFKLKTGDAPAQQEATG